MCGDKGEKFLQFLNNLSVYRYLSMDSGHSIMLCGSSRTGM